LPGGPGSFTSDSTSLMLIWRAHGNGDLSMSHTGLSPSMVRLSRLFRYRWFCNPSVLPQPRTFVRFGLCPFSLAATYGELTGQSDLFIALPALRMSVQVAPPLASSGCNRRLVSGFPLTPTPLASLAPRLRVSPDPHSQLAFRLAPRVAAVPQSSGYTGRRFLESPRFFRPSAPPCLNPRVAPFFRPCGNASDRFSPGFPWVGRVAPASSIFR